MTVKNGDFIRIDYTESVEGQVIAATNIDVAREKGIYNEENQYGPHLIVVGAGQLVKGFEEDIVDKEIGYSGKVEIPPEMGFGSHDPKKVEIIPINRFKEQKPMPGMRVGVENKAGNGHKGDRQKGEHRLQPSSGWQDYRLRVQDFGVHRRPVGEA